MYFAKSKNIRSMGFVRAALLIFLLIAIGAALILQQMLARYWLAEDQIVYSTSELVVIGERDSLRKTLSRINSRAQHSHPLVDRMVLRLYASDVVIKTGEYEVSGSYSRQQLFELFGSGQSKQYPMTLIEGFTLAEILQALKAAEALNNKNLDANVETDESLLLGFLDVDVVAELGGGSNPEGWLFPDTYYFSRNASPKDVFRRAHQTMITTLKTEWENRAADLPLESPYEALILASIIEKESGHIDEREKISGVFVRRLQKGMRLQTDPTVIYGMGEKYQGNIKREDLKRDTPYNTYTRSGLPPTPIGMPGLASIKAALHPAEGSALYFVAKGDGSHVFSDTLEEHNRAVRQYQIFRRRADYQSAPQQR